jgi:nucleotide-binding universal stress UspA family protein
VRVLSAVENIVTPASELWYDAGGNLEETRQQITSQAARLTAEVAEKVRTSGLTVETAVRDGDPRSVIIDEATEWDADLIVVGSHGYTGIKRLLTGKTKRKITMLRVEFSPHPLTDFTWTTFRGSAFPKSMATN